MKKILFVMTSLGQGGAEKALVNLLTRLSKNREYEIDLLLLKNEGDNFLYLPKEVNVLDSLKETEFVFNPIKWKASKRFNKVMLGYFISRIIFKIQTRNLSKSNKTRQKRFLFWRKFSKYVSRNSKEYDIAIGYIHSIPNYYVIDKVTANLKFGWVHNDMSKIESFDEEIEYFSEFTNLITISKECKDHLENRFPTLDNVKVLYNLNNPENIIQLSTLFKPLEYLELSSVKLLTIGRFSMQKGYDIAIETAELLKDLKLNFTWFLMGQGELLDKMKALVRQKDLGDKIVFLGIKKNPYPYIAGSDIIVQTSRYEGKSIVLDEAKILRKLIVTTNYPSVSDQITHLKNGVVSGMNSKTIANNIVKLISSKSLKMQLYSNLDLESNKDDHSYEEHLNLFGLKNAI